MPFKSFAQARYMYANHPKIARTFAEKTNFADIPERVSKLSTHKRSGKWKPSSDGMVKS